MNEADALELIRSAIWTIIVGSGPPVAAAMFVGLIIALLQALTQIQETTLTFVPKIVVIFLVLSFGGPFIGAQIFAFTEHVYGRIEKGY
ncbi:flagellar biosynthetic protein FliQ [Methylocella silvestris BL2]|uniref:Flagellar biosynthetic protein FliQ n=1 Tax=Methylocella silvestris (strain DSM 15510 / CIP 108128 / LMG 27833 / NCIMB 13906 / BL2) TaxID=395965 RepID=B8EL36_METSB|nr:flagellar biosynthesis protein FliQ [Methylocella silvestris]ACK49031.1 flagellar biosynthetic protein FliQ [Methylocella silvestris BL2]